MVLHLGKREGGSGAYNTTLGRPGLAETLEKEGHDFFNPLTYRQKEGGRGVKPYCKFNPAFLSSSFFKLEKFQLAPKNNLFLAFINTLIMIYR